MQIAGSEPPPLPDPPAALRGALARPLGAPSLERFVEPGDRVAILATPESRELLVPELEATCRRAGASEVVVRVAEEAGGKAALAPAGATGWRALGWTRFGIARVAPVVARADKLILSGAISFHPLAGFGGGGLLLLPFTAPESAEAVWARAIAEAPAPSPVPDRSEGGDRCLTVAPSRGPRAAPASASVPGFAEGKDRGLTDAPSHAAHAASAFAGKHALVRHPLAQAGVLEGNPVQDALGELLALAPPAFLVELAFQRGGRPAAVFAGDPALAHGSAADFLRKWHAVPLREAFDWVVSETAGRELGEVLAVLDRARAALRPGGATIVRLSSPEPWDDPAPPALLAPTAGTAPLQILVSEKGLGESASAAGLVVTRNLDAAFSLARKHSGAPKRIAHLPEPQRTLPVLVAAESGRPSL